MGNKVFKEFEGENRFEFPDKIIRVTAGSGGESLIIIGSEKNCLYDCGMAFCAEDLIKNIELALNRECVGLPKNSGNLDYIIISHTHYDHIGGLPYVLDKWPDAIVFGAEYAEKVFTKPGAIRMMKKLGEEARLQYRPNSRDEIKSEGMRVDRIIREGEILSLGDEYIDVLETKGHTDCSLTYILQPMGLMLASESTGVLQSPNSIHVAILKSYHDSMVAIGKCSKYGAAQIVSPHYGMIPKEFNDRYWELFVEFAQAKRTLISEFYERGLSETEMLEEYKNIFWNDAHKAEQPLGAFLENAKNIIRAILK